VAILRTPDRRFQGNHGLSTLESGENDESFSEVEVPTMTLSQVLEQCGGPIGVLKIDIEGHELRVFTACRDLLRAGMVRDIIFEDHAGTNSELSNLLISFGYSVFNLSKTPLGPVLLDRNEPEHWYRVSEDFNFLATLDRDRARRRMARRGFICLRRQYHPRKRP